MSRIALPLLSVAFAVQALAQRGTPDPAFEKVPFERWLSQADEGRFRWTAGVSRSELSFQQRLRANVEAKLDGRDLENRRGKGKLVFLIQITDSDGNHYQDHDSIELDRLNENVKDTYLEFIQPVFLLPGDYRLAVAILDTATGEHSARQEQFRVAAPKHELLAGAWRDLPPVEFITDKDSPASWYLPGIHSRLQWAASVHSGARLEVVLAVAASVPTPGSHHAVASDLPALLPTLKVLSEAGSSSVSAHVELVDLSRQRVVFDQALPDQSAAHELDWTRLKASLGEANTASIDVRSLAQQHHAVQFFLSTLRSLLRDSEPPCVLVVLTKPLAFDSGEDLQPVSSGQLPACRIAYIRYDAPPERISATRPDMRGFGGGGRIRDPMTWNRLAPSVLDQLEPTLKPLVPKVFDVQTPEQMARALHEIAAMLGSGRPPPR